MKFSPNGAWLMGGVGGGVPLRLMPTNNPSQYAPPAALVGLLAGGWDWQDDDRVLGNAAPSSAGPWHLRRYHLTSQQVDDLDARGCTSVWGGGGQWLAWLASNPPQSYDAALTWNAASGRFAFGVSDAGDELFVNVARTQIIVRNPQQQEVTYPTAPLFPHPGIVGQRGVLFYCDTSYQLRCIGRPDPQTPKAGGRGAQPVILPDGRMFIAQWDPNYGQLVVYEARTPTAGPLVGWSLSGDQHDYNHDICYRASDGALLVGTGVNAGETAARLYEVDITNRRMRVNGGSWRAITSIDLAAWPSVVVPGVPAMPTIATCVFNDPFVETDAPYEIVVNGAAPRSDRPRFCGEDDASLTFFRIGMDEGIYTEASTPDEMRAAIAKAVDRHTRLKWCHDGSDFDRTLIPMLRPWDVVALECYPVGRETVDETYDRCSTNLDALLNVCDNLIALILPDYDAGGVPPNELRTPQQTLDVCARLLGLGTRSSRIVFLDPFEIRRDNGADVHPELMTWTRRLVAQTARSVALVAVPHPAPPPAPPPTQGDWILMAQLGTVQGIIYTYGPCPDPSGTPGMDRVTVKADKSEVASIQFNTDGTMRIDNIGWNGHSEHELCKITGNQAVYGIGGKFYLFMLSDVTGIPTGA